MLNRDYKEIDMNNKKPHEGHRQRMWQKYLEHGIEIFEEHELLEILLFILIPRVNTNEISHDLIDRFGSLKNVLDAPFGDLQQVKGIGINSAVELRFISDIADYVNRKKHEAITFNSSSAIIDFCVDYYKNKSDECVSFFLLDDKLTLIYKDDMKIDKPNQTDFDYGTILKQVIKFECHAVILSHNHPEGSAYASNIDVTATRTLASLLKAIGVKIVDHIVIQGSTGYSMRKSGEATELWY